MKIVIKIELIILFLLCSIYIFLDYSFNVDNIFLEHNIKIAYTFNEDISEEQIVEKISEISENTKEDIYYEQQGRNLQLYNFRSDDSNTYTNIGNGRNKEIKLSNFYRDIRIYNRSFLKKNAIDVSKGYLIVKDGINKEKILSQLNTIGMNIESMDSIEWEDSEYLQDFIPLLFIIILFLLVTLAIELLLDKKKITIKYLEGSNKNEIVYEHVYNFLKLLISPMLIVYLIFNIIMIYLGNLNWIYHYTIYTIYTFIVLLIIKLLLCNIMIRKFNVINLKNAINDKFIHYILYILKIVVLTIMLGAFGLSLNLFNKYQRQMEQINYQKDYENYYKYDIMDDGSTNGDKEQEATIDKMINIYINTYKTNDVIVTSAFKLSENTKYNDYIVSPYYMQKYDKDIKDENAIVVYTSEKANNAYEKELREKLAITKNVPLKIKKCQSSQIFVIDEEGQIKKIKYNDIIILNPEIINKSEIIRENMSYIMQTFYFKYNSQVEKNNFDNSVKENNLSEMINHINSIKDNTSKILYSINKKLLNNILITVFSIISMFICIYILNKLHLFTMSKRKIIMNIEGYSEYEINKNENNINIILYIIAYIIYYNNLFIYKKWLILLISIIFLAIVYVFDYKIKKYFYKKYVLSKMINKIKGER